jgi:hypothetical protein
VYKNLHFGRIIFPLELLLRGITSGFAFINNESDDLGVDDVEDFNDTCSDGPKGVRKKRNVAKENAKSRK